MIISCKKCDTKYRVRAGSIDSEGRKVRCTKCNYVWTQNIVKTEHKKVKPTSPINFSRRLPVVIEYVVPKWFRMLPIVLSFLVILTGAFVFQDSLGKYFSFSKTLYEKIGMSFTDNVEIHNVEIIKKSGNSIDINGFLVNKSSASKILPNIIVRSIGGKKGMESFVINPPSHRFNGGEKYPFFKRVENFSSDTKMITLEIEDKIDRFFRKS